MLTSFAPSPIERVTFSGNLLLIILTMSAFYFGDTLHANTTSTRSEADKNFSFKLSIRSIAIREAPATIMACFYVESAGLWIL